VLQRTKIWFRYGMVQTLAIPSGFGRSRIRDNCSYTLLYVVLTIFLLFVFLSLISHRVHKPLGAIGYIRPLSGVPCVVLKPNYFHFLQTLYSQLQPCCRAVVRE